MFGTFISRKKFELQIDCFCPEAIHANVLTINKGDIIEVTNDYKFTMENGWYVLVKFTSQRIFYIGFEDLEYHFMKERLLNKLDIDLSINYLQFKINQSLEAGDKERFIHFTNDLKELSEFKVRLEQYLSNGNMGIVPQFP